MIHNTLHNIKVVLASASPRRKQIFELLGINALIVPANVSEPITTEKPYIQVKAHALNKALAIAKFMDPATLVVGSDTIVAIDNQVLGKPATRRQATEHLQQLSGRTHNVYSAICIIYNNRRLVDYARTSVTFATLSESDIKNYLDTKEPFDKAGAYGVQGYGSQFIEKINGCYFNVMGFPVRLFHDMINEMFGESS
ncbi:MAG: septum formation protein Maf [Candidatus Cloacimonetes bacterium HGW-Cloacimonetes-1]|jgi:septum formation protein|nr:MAG: septum formation protein Maf [Candidatus Cloacimonetes bacterium HGW-Cloacimonetes-1]